ncbi:MAG: flagellar export protein FliJ [Dissulfurispiraceae bacterium]|jgi:flagellar FliJ protein|nr:flagellar export protein FliJ [Dissulfurispiraceae bacterium]
MSTIIESLLKIKRWTEDDAKNKFAEILKALSAEEHRLAELEQQYKSIVLRIKSEAGMEIDIDKLKKMHEYSEHMLSKIQLQKIVVLAKEADVETARKILTEATKDKKIFEKLDEKEKTAIKAEHKKNEQIRTDEHASAKFRHENL